MRSVLVCIDHSDVTSRVVETATELALSMGAKARLLHVVPPEHDFIMYSPGGGMPMASSAVATDMKLETERLQKLADAMAAVGLQAEVKLVEGNAQDSIMAEIALLKPDWVVVGSHGHGALYEVLVGSTTEGVLRRSHVPVMVVPWRDEAIYE